MASTTTNLGLTKPDRSDNVSIDVLNANYDILDNIFRYDADNGILYILTPEQTASAEETTV